MKKILAIDYGEKKIGLAISEYDMASPYKVIKIKDREAAIEKITKIIKDQNIQEVVIGVSSGKMKENILNFVQLFEERINIPVETIDENFSTKMAISKSIEAGQRQKKRKQMEDAYAAAIFLQDYLENKN